MDTQKPISNNMDTAVESVSTTVRDEPESLSLTNEAIRLIDLKGKLGLDATDRTYDKELKGILDLARESGIKNKNQLQAVLKTIQYKLGMSDTGGERVKKIYHYMKLERNIQSLVNQQTALYSK